MIQVQTKIWRGSKANVMLSVENRASEILSAYVESQLRKQIRDKILPQIGMVWFQAKAQINARNRS